MWRDGFLLRLVLGEYSQAYKVVQYLCLIKSYREGRHENPGLPSEGFSLLFKRYKAIGNSRVQCLQIVIRHLGQCCWSHCHIFLASQRAKISASSWSPICLHDYGVPQVIQKLFLIVDSDLV